MNWPKGWKRVPCNPAIVSGPAFVRPEDGSEVFWHGSFWVAEPPMPKPIMEPFDSAEAAMEAVNEKYPLVGGNSHE